MAYARAPSSLLPHIDPMRAPTALGQHPHMEHESDDRTGDNSEMYESLRRDGVYRKLRPKAPLPVRPHPATPPEALGQVAAPSSGDNVASTLLLLGVAGLAVYALTQSTKARAEAEAAARGAPSANPAPVAAAPAEPAPTLPPAPPAPQAKPKRPHVRRTTQARDASGHFLPAGTRKRAVTEGKS